MAFYKPSTIMHVLQEEVVAGSRTATATAFSLPCATPRVIMSMNEEGIMHILRLLVLPLLISLCAAPVAAQSSSDKNPSRPLSTQPQSAQASIRLDQLQLPPFPRDRNDPSDTMLGAMGAGEHPSTMSGKAMALIGLRMMPTFPSPPLKFRTAGFPRYGFKAGISDEAFPTARVCLRPSCPLLSPSTPCSVSGTMRR